jgi:hypothetical protein
LYCSTSDAEEDAAINLLNIVPTTLAGVTAASVSTMVSTPFQLVDRRRSGPQTKLRKDANLAVDSKDSSSNDKALGHGPSY